MYFVSIDAGAQVTIILLVCGPCVVIVNCWDRFCTLGRAPRTKETLPDFRECCWVTRLLLVFRGLTGCQRDTPVLGRHNYTYIFKIFTKRFEFLKVYDIIYPNFLSK